MFLFLRLVLAHLIADFPFQTKEIYQRKLENIWGQILHAQIVAITVAFVCWPYTRYHAFWLLVLLFAISHVLVDSWKVRFINRHLPLFWSFLLDQALHIAAFFPVFLFDFSRQPPQVIHPLVSIYNNDLLVISLIGYLVVSFEGAWLLDVFKRTFFSGGHLANPSLRLLNYGLIERLSIMTIFAFLPPAYYLSVPILFLARQVFLARSWKFEFLLNLIYSAAVGLILKAIINQPLT
jgi:hypothetical protein